MPNSSPPLTPTLSSSRNRLLTNQKPKKNKNSAPALIHLPLNDKKTRDQPNLSDCHGCGLRIDFGNPKQRLQPLDSFWRVVLLCNKCIKQVNSGKICLYCFKDTDNSVSDCFSCSDCERLIHKECVKKFGDSTPWSYCRRDLGLGLDFGFSVCIDCWVPELLKSSIKVARKKKKNENGGRFSEEMVEDANRAVEEKVAMVMKAKEKALRKAVVAKNAVELASDALELAVKKDCSGKMTSEGLARNSSYKGNGVSDVTRVVDDAELAFQLHRAMNSSPRISKNICSVNLSYLDVLKKMGSGGISSKWMDSARREGGKVRICTNSRVNENQERSISDASAHLESKESVFVRLKPALKTYSRNNLKRKECSENGEVGDVVKTLLKTYTRSILKKRQFLENGDSGGLENGEGGEVMKSAVLKPVLRTYKRNNLKRKECLENREVADVVTSVGVGIITLDDDSKIVSESQFCLQDETKTELQVDSTWASSPDQSNGDIVQQQGSGIARPKQYLLKYSKRPTGSGRGLQNDASSDLVAFPKENQASAPRSAYCSTECSGLSDASLPSCVVNLQGCASVVGSSQEGD